MIDNIDGSQEDISCKDSVSLTSHNHDYEREESNQY
jgi:hypothetical protein